MMKDSNLSLTHYPPSPPPSPLSINGQDNINKELDWLTLDWLLKEGQYEAVAEFLDQRGHVELLALNDLVRVAQQICWLGHQYQVEVERFQQAAAKAGALEAALRQQLRGLIARLYEKEIIESSILSSQPLLEPQPVFKISCFGVFEVQRQNEPLTAWTSLKGRAIFKYLVAHSATPVPRDILMELFWPETEPEAARRNLHQAIYSLRADLRQGGPDNQPVLFDHDCYLLNPELPLWIDIVEFEQRLRLGQQYTRTGCLAEAALAYGAAEALYQGEFLEEDLYEEWTQLPREQFRQNYLSMANWLSDYYLQQGEYPLAIQLCQKIVRRDPCAEEAHCRLMRCYQALGQRQLAIRQYQNCLKLLEAELDVPPSPETRQLYEQIMRGA